MNHDTDRFLRSRHELFDTLSGRPAECQSEHYQGIPRRIHSPSPILPRCAGNRSGKIASRRDRRSPRRSIPGLPGARKTSPRTRNHRLAALHAFFRYVQAEEPARMHQCQKILAIPLRKHARPTVGYLSKEELVEILAQPDLRTSDGRRDAVLLSVLYDTGARVQELIDLSVGDVRLDPPAQLRLMGKGRKMRAVPLMENTVQLLRNHIQENHLNRPEQFDKPLFRNARNQHLSRSGIRYILQKYLVTARSKRPSLNRTVSPHTLRHSKGMHLLQSGISLDMIRDFLGHVDVKTTQIYARANLEMKRKALEKISDPSAVPSIPSWQQNKDLLDWLRSL